MPEAKIQIAMTENIITANKSLCLLTFVLMASNCMIISDRRVYSTKEIFKL